MVDNDVTYTVKEVAKMLKISEATVRRLIDRGELASIKVGSSVRITRTELDRYLGRE